jgi:hypothetical protein
MAKEGDMVLIHARYVTLVISTGLTLDELMKTHTGWLEGRLCFAPPDAKVSPWPVVCPTAATYRTKSTEAVITRLE